MQLEPIGTVRNTPGEVALCLGADYAPALLGLEGFSHVCVLWWCSELDSAEARALRQVPKPYRQAPETMGIFATRSPVRPNPIALSVAEVAGLDVEKGILTLYYIDAKDGTPLLDIKPYTPSADRVEAPSVPAWCAHWPKSLETSASFAWADEFLF